MTAGAVTNPTEEQTRRALVWARSPDHPSVLALLDSCPELSWSPAERTLISAPEAGLRSVKVWLDGADLWMEIQHGHRRGHCTVGRFIRIPRHIIDAETPT